MLGLLSFLLAVLLFVSSFYAAALHSVRSHFSPEYVYNFMNSLDYASLELPTGSDGQSDSLRNIVNSAASEFGVRFSDDDIAYLINNLSINALLSAFVQDLRSWAFDNGAAPMLDAEEMAHTVAVGMDQNLLMLLSYYGDIEAMLADAIADISENANLDDTFRQAEPYRELLSAGTLVFVLSICATLFLLILITRRLKLVPTMVISGITWSLCGSLLIFTEQLLSPLKAELLAASQFPEGTLDLVYKPLIDSLHGTGVTLALTGLAIVVVFAVIGTFAGMIQREKARTAAMTAERTARAAAYQQYQPYQPSMQNQPQNLPQNHSANDNYTDN